MSQQKYDLIPKRTSVVWNYFDFRKDDVDQKQALCRECFALVAAAKGNPTNLFSHSIHHHESLYYQCTLQSLTQRPCKVKHVSQEDKISQQKETGHAVLPEEARVLVLILVQCVHCAAADVLAAWSVRGSNINTRDAT